MRIDIDYPILFRARPKKAKAEKRVYCTIGQRVDVPEVSLRDTEAVLECAPRLDDGGPFVMRSYDGRLYRKVADSVDDAVETELLSEPFDNTERWTYRTHKREFADWAGVAAGSLPTDYRPFSKPLARQFEWQMARETLAGDLNKEAWPPRRGNVMEGLHAHRNGVRFEDIFGQLEGIVEADLAAAAEMRDIRSGKILAIDGELWMESAPMGFRVEFQETSPLGNDRGFTQGFVSVSMCTVPEGYSGDFYPQYFALADRDGAMAEAETLMKMLARRQKTNWLGEAPPPLLKNGIVPHHYTDEALLSYDRDLEAVRRFGYTAAVECRRAVARDANLTDKLDAVDLAVIDRAFEQVDGSNYVTGVHGDMAEHCHELERVWTKIAHQQMMPDGSVGVHGVQLERKRVFKAIDRMPISLSAASFSL